jgi:ABC-type xylose transport system permease subunit
MDSKSQQIMKGLVLMAAVDVYENKKKGRDTALSH